MKSASSIAKLLAITVICFIGYQGKVSSHSNVTDSQLRQLTEELFSHENSDFRNHVRANLQGYEMQRPYMDLSRQPLLTVDPTALRTPLLKCVQDLFDNYETDILEEEIVTSVEHDEQEIFLDHLLTTDSIRRVMNFLSDRGFIEGGNETYKNTLRNLWFSQFARQKKSTVPGSSAFEHVFLGELKSGRKLIGMHNWIFINAAERAGLLDYWGYRRTRNLGNSTASVSDVVFFYLGTVKSSTIFIGTSPELEMASYTLCYFVRPNKYCRVSMGGTRFGIQTYALNHAGNNPRLGTAYPTDRSYHFKDNRWASQVCR